MTTKTLNRILTILRLSAITNFATVILLAAFYIFLPPGKPALVFALIIPLLLIGIMGVVCAFFYSHFKEIESRNRNNAINKKLEEENRRLSAEYAELRKKCNGIRMERIYYKRYHTAAINKLEIERERTSTLMRLIENTFNRVLDNSNLGE